MSLSKLFRMIRFQKTQRAMKSFRTIFLWSWVSTLLTLAVLTGTPAHSDALDTEWSMTSDEVAIKRPTASLLDPAQKTKGGLIYKLTETGVLLEPDHTFTAHYFFRESSDLLDLIVLELKSGLPGSLFNTYDKSDLPRSVKTELQVIQKIIIHEVHFTDAARNNLIIYDRIGDECTLIYKPIKRGDPF